MKQIRVKGRMEYHHASDIRRIQEALYKNGYLASEDQCDSLWGQYSDSMAAGWMTVPDNDAEILAAVSPYFEETDPKKCIECGAEIIDGDYDLCLACDVPL